MKPRRLQRETIFSICAWDALGSEDMSGGWGMRLAE
jgi:hypothetical protein